MVRNNKVKMQRIKGFLITQNNIKNIYKEKNLLMYNFKNMCYFAMIKTLADLYVIYVIVCTEYRPGMRLKQHSGLGHACQVTWGQLLAYY